MKTDLPMLDDATIGRASADIPKTVALEPKSGSRTLLEVPLTVRDGHLEATLAGIAVKPAINVTADNAIVVSRTDDTDSPDCCIRCSDKPVVKSDLTKCVEAGSPKAQCGEAWKNEVGWIIDWRNEEAAKQDDEDYMKGATDASVYAKVEVLDELLAAGGALVGFFSALPQNLLQVTMVDDQIRDIGKRIDKVLNGKLNINTLLGQVKWEFELKRKSTVRIAHTQLWKSFVLPPKILNNTNGIYDFSAHVLLDTVEVDDLTLPDARERTALTASEGDSVDATSNDTSRLRKSRRRSSSSQTKILTLSGGLHDIEVSYTLNAGYGGVLKEEDVKTITEKFDELSKAAQDVVRAAAQYFAAAFGPTAPASPGVSPIEGLAKALKDAVSAALGLAKELLAIVQALISKSIAYVRLFTSRLFVVCITDAEEGAQLF